MTIPSVFISYSHDSEQHKAWVRRLAEEIRQHGVNATLDQWDLSLGQDIATFMQKGILDADRVLLVCSETYVRKAEAGVGGVGFERLIVTSEVVQNIDTRKFIPLVRANASEPFIPRFLGPRLYINFNDDATYEVKREELLRELLGAPANVKPPLGANPFSVESTKQPATLANRPHDQMQWTVLAKVDASSGIPLNAGFASIQYRLWSDEPGVPLLLRLSSNAEGTLSQELSGPSGVAKLMISEPQTFYVSFSHPRVQSEISVIGYEF
ncbi:toll/interleukin-1 receptor domain-containing protein [Ralstonia solanacearum]|uniref:toll/interleukin-1 receptor domain-containing protein n=1 Tax=Ralstonia solanacearum TaxID=305 RepID=UPI001F08BB35|nr:toll/interleukin-1 receptor domain-containing protein [Ralstonia solanacearum]